MSAASDPTRVLMGRLGAPHGVRGEMRLQSFTGDPEAIADYGPLTDRAGQKTFTLLSVRALGKDMLVARLEGVASREAAAALNGVELFLPRDRLPATEDEDEFYLADLIGLRAQTPAGADIGRVIAVRNFGAGDILEIAPAGGGETLLFPFTKAVVPEVSIADGQVVIEPPEEGETDREATEQS
jgi:16S rRNA processing protein RimM